MKTVLIPLLCCCAISTCWADDVSLDSGSPARVVEDFYKAEKNHDLDRLNALIADNATIEVWWMQRATPKKTTLTKAELLQQIAAKWHFSTAESYDYGKEEFSTSRETGLHTVTFKAHEKRTVFDQETGENSDMTFVISGDDENSRITMIQAKASLW